MAPITRTSFALLLAVYALGFTDASAKPSLSSKLQDAKAGVMVIAHRGCWNDAPENSLAAVEACIRIGVDMVELDVQRSSDGVLVLMHDLTVDRTSSGQGAVSALQSTEILKLRLKERDGSNDSALTDQTVPTLAQALSLTRDQILVNIDAKADVYKDVSELIVAMGMTKQVLMKMPAAPTDPRLRSIPLMRQAHFMPVIDQRLGHGPLEQLVPGYDDLSPVAYEIIFQSEAYLQNGAAALSATNRRVWANSLRPEHAAGHTDAAALKSPDLHWGRLLNLGVTMIQTDYPEVLMSYLEKRGLR